MVRQCVALASVLATVGAMPRPLPGGVPWTAAQLDRLQRAVNRLLVAPALRGAQVGFLAIDTQRRTLLYSVQPDQEFMPASNFKLLVGSAALETLGQAFSYATTVLVDAPPQNGVENGNLYLRGGGDALLSAGDLDQAAQTVAAAGITRVTGSVVTDATQFDDQRLGFGWSWDDLVYYYAPVVSALELEDGVAHVRMTPGGHPGDPVQLAIEPQSGAFTIDNQLTTGAAGSKDTSDIFRRWDQPRTITLIGSYPLGAPQSGDLQPSVPDPESYAGDVFNRALEAHGVTVSGALTSGRAPQDAATLWTHRSPMMAALLERFWYPSDNLMGELLLKELGLATAGAPGTDEHGAAAERRFLRTVGIDPATVTIGDGSGLSQYDRITPRDLVKILQYDWVGPNRNVVLDALPLAGVRGTLEHSFVGTAAAHEVWAKTGSISHVRTISGFIQTKTHGVVTFSLLINQWMGEDSPGGAAALARVRGALLSEFAAQ